MCELQLLVGSGWRGGWAPYAEVQLPVQHRPAQRVGCYCLAVLGDIAKDVPHTDSAQHTKALVNAVACMLLLL